MVKCHLFYDREIDDIFCLSNRVDFFLDSDTLIIMKLAVIKTGGKQYKVASGQKIKIEKLEGKEGDKITFDEVLLLAAEPRGTKTQNDAEIKIGQPKIEGVKVAGKILKQDRAKKVTIFKYKPKKRYQVKRGHRQPFSLVEIETIK